MAPLAYLPYLNLSAQNFYQHALEVAHLSFQEKNLLLTMLADWQIAQALLPTFPPMEYFGNANRQQAGQKLMAYCRQYYQAWQNELPTYPLKDNHHSMLPTFGWAVSTPPVQVANNELRLGHCPVNSPQTRCCQLYTLDVVRGCPLGCAYCSLQTFSHAQEILLTSNLKEKLDALPLPEGPIHIGTGQASDSLVWGNQHGILQDLLAWAQENPQVILELKTKSNQVDALLDLQRQNLVPPNVIVAWSLNPPALAGEEPWAASVEKRLIAAEKVAAAGIWVGFHWHPMIHYKGWEDDYACLAQEMLRRFSPEQVMMLSMGTLTYTAKVIGQIRATFLREKKSTKVLQIPWTICGSKYSYPLAIKQEMFTQAYQLFTPWHGKVYFYLCMEDASLSPLVGHDYQSNEEFAEDLTRTYASRIIAQN